MRWSLLTLLLLIPFVQADAYDDYHAFASNVFGAEKDDLIYQKFGNSLQILDYWEYVSQNSAAISFSTNLPADAYVEYGTTTAYGSQTSIDDRKYYQHVHHVQGLNPGTMYHYRVVATDERGNLIQGPDRTITPQTIANVIRIPQDMSGPPYNLNQANRHYLVTQDLTINARAFNVQANGISLDLGGHTITYNNANTPISGPFTNHINNGAFGVISKGRSNYHVVNGHVKQGLGQNSAQESIGIGFNPFYIEGASNVEIAGTILEYGGNQITGIYTRYGSGNFNIHHNIILDRGTGITNRHNAVRSVLVDSSSSNHIHHNLIKRTRQAALTGGVINDNEVHIDSFATNSMGVFSLASNRDVYNNKIFGTGYHVVGLGWGGYNHMYDNFIHLHGQGPDYRYPEYGNQESLNGIRLTQYNGATEDYSNNIYEDNLVIITGGACSDDGECTKTRGLQYFSDPYVRDNVIRNNIIKVVMNNVTNRTGALATEGQIARCGNEDPLVYDGNTIISNFANIVMGDDYGIGCNHWFYNNHLVKVGHRADYRTIKYGTSAPINEHYFYDTTFENGADLTSPVFKNPAQEYTVGWTLTTQVKDGSTPVQGASVTYKDSNGITLATGSTDSNGEFSALVDEYTENGNGRTYFTPTEVTVNDGGNQEVQSVNVDRTKTVVINLAPAEPAILMYSGMGSDQEIYSPQIHVEQMPSLSQAVVELNAGDITYEAGPPGMPGLAARIDGYQPDYEFAVFDIDNFDFSDPDDDGGRIDYWIKYLGSPQETGKNVFIARSDGIIAGPPYWFFTMEVVRSGYPYFEFLGGSPRSGSTGRLVVHPDHGSWSGFANMNAGEWHLFTLTWRRNGPERDRAELHFYIDGTNEGCSGCNDYSGNLAPPHSMSKLIFNDYNTWGGQIGPQTTLQFSLDELYSFDSWELNAPPGGYADLVIPDGITLAYPWNGITLDTPTPSFEFIALQNAYSGVCTGSNQFTCELHVDGALQSTRQVCHDTLVTIQGTSYSTGSHDWFVRCNGLPDSPTYSFTIDTGVFVCGDGDTQNCNTTESCPGQQTCSSNAWSSCEDTPGDGCPDTCTPTVSEEDPVIEGTGMCNGINDDCDTLTDEFCYGDVNGDGETTVADLSEAAQYFRVQDTDTNWDEAEHADQNGDGKINIVDLIIIASNF